MINHNSSDGSCSGELFPFGDSTLVLADTQQDAIDLCQSLGGFDVHYSWPDDGWPDLPADTWVCIA